MSDTYDEARTEALPLAVQPNEETTAIPPAAHEADEDLFEPGWDQPKRTSKVTLVLVAGLVAALGFTGGVLVQKNHDVGLLGGAGAGRTRTFGGGNGGAGGGAGGGRTGAGASATPAATPGGTGGPAPVVVGTVARVNGATLAVTNFAGTTVTVTVPPGATVTSDGLDGLVAGATVTVAGTRNPDGSVTASAVTSHRAS